MKQIVRPIWEKLIQSIVFGRPAGFRVESFNRRYMAIHEVADYLVGARVLGDYAEFGVFKGDTFSYACNHLSPLFPDMHFYAFDSFEGLPKPKGVDAEGGYSSSFQESDFKYDKSHFLKNLRSKGVNLNKVTAVEGWFDESLKPEKAQEYNIENISVAWIDCDLYESTVPVLQFLTNKILPGSVIIFDDWRCFRNDPNYGEQRACTEWLEMNPQIRLNELFSFGWHGIAFTVTSC